MTKKILSIMRKRRKGRVINISSGVANAYLPLSA